jgi:hypothetical protein
MRKELKELQEIQEEVGIPAADAAISAIMENPYRQNGFSAPPRVQIKKITYTHDAMIDKLIEDPSMSQAALARHFGYTQSWISQILNSDAFRERLAERKDAVIDPVLRLSVEERIRGMVDQATQVIMRKLEEAPNASVAIKALTAGSQALGMGQRGFGAAVVQNNYIAVVPPTAKSAAEWANQYKPEPLTIEAPSTVGRGESRGESDVEK